MDKPTENPQESKPQQEKAFLKIEMQTTGLKEFFANVPPGADVVARLRGKEIGRFKMPG